MIVFKLIRYRLREQTGGTHATHLVMLTATIDGLKYDSIVKEIQPRRLRRTVKILKENIVLQLIK